MILFIILLWGAGMAIIPIGRLYVSHSLRKPDSKMHDNAYYKKFLAIVYIVSISISLVALYLVDKYLGE